MSLLDQLDLSQSLAKTDYEARIRELQESLARVALKLYRKKQSTIFVFEGMDAAGKGGALKRLVQRMDPELYQVNPVAAPTSEERSYHYLRRFLTRLPGPGRLVVFDRSWYGRVLVERVEGFAQEEEWQRAYNEINAMERSFIRAGIPVVKFWLQIGLDEQMQRFTDRQNSPLKSWKITDEDWRNREKWTQYKAAVEDMLARTSPSEAPWHLIEGNDKLFARVKVCRIALEALRNRP